MAKRPPLAADSRDGVAATLYLWLVVGFMLGLVAELAILGMPGLMNASLVVVFAIPLAAGAACMGLIWSVNRAFGPPGVVLASWSGGGIYAGMFAAALTMKLLASWRFAMPVLLAGMAAGLLAGAYLGLVRIKAGDRDVFRP